MQGTAERDDAARMDVEFAVYRDVAIEGDVGGTGDVQSVERVDRANHAGDMHVGGRDQGQGFFRRNAVAIQRMGRRATQLNSARSRGQRNVVISQRTAIDQDRIVDGDGRCRDIAGRNRRRVARTVNRQRRIIDQSQILMDPDFAAQQRIHQHQRIRQHDIGMPGRVTNYDVRIALRSTDQDLAEAGFQITQAGVADVQRTGAIQPTGLIVTQENRAVWIECGDAQLRAGTANRRRDVQLIRQQRDVLA